MRIERTAQMIFAIRAGDMIMASPGAKMNTIVNAHKKRFPGKTADDQAAA